MFSGSDPPTDQAHPIAGACSPDSLVAEGPEVVAGGQAAAAEDALKRALQVDPQALPPRLELAELYTHRGQPIEAAFQWREVLAAQPSHARAAEQLRLLEPLLTAIRDVRRFNPPELQITVRRNAIIVTLIGVMSPYGEEEENLRDGFERLAGAVTSLMELKMRGCVIDMARVSFVTSYFLSQLLEWLRTTRRHGGKLVICNVRPEIREVMKLTRLGPLIPMAQSLESAIDSVLSASARAAGAI